MPELQSCYFCGDIGDPLTGVDVVPADLADESTQRTVVVCSTCQRKLDAVLAPLRDLAVAGGSVTDTDAGTADTDTGAVDVDDRPTTDDDATSDDSTSRDEGATTDSSPSADEETAETAEAAGPNDATGAIDAESPLAPTDRVEESPADAESGGITFPDAAGSPDDGTAATGDGVEFPDDADGVGTDDEPDRDDSAGEAATTSDERSGDRAADTSSGDPSSDDPPTGYRKVVRLLQNREFPVDRESFVDLASNAYELAETDVSASLDRLVERGALVETDGQLQKP